MYDRGKISKIDILANVYYVQFIYETFSPHYTCTVVLLKAK